MRKNYLQEILNMNNEHKEILNEFVKMFTKDHKELQKKYKNEAHEKYLGKFSPYAHLWNLTNKEWVKHRKDTWNKLIEREKAEGRYFVKSYWENIERFFLRAKPRKNDEEIRLYSKNGIHAL